MNISILQMFTQCGSTSTQWATSKLIELGYGYKSNS